MNLYFLIYIAVIIYITIPLIKIIWNDLLDNDLIFLLCTNYILLLLLSIMFSTYSLIYSILISFTLMLLSFLLIRKIKSILGHYQILSIPYFIFIVFTFSSLISLF